MLRQFEKNTYHKSSAYDSSMTSSMITLCPCFGPKAVLEWEVETNTHFIFFIVNFTEQDI